MPRRCHLKSQRGSIEMIGSQFHLTNHVCPTRLSWPEQSSVTRCHDEDVQSIGTHGGIGRLTMICTLLDFLF